jgi:hypothetical protein
MKYLFFFLNFLFLSLISQAQFQLNGVTTNLGGGTYQLTPAANSQFGAIWYQLQHNLNNPFNVQGQLNFGNDPGGADGITFIMQNNCLAAGGSGGGIGYLGMPGQSIAVEFDTYQNIVGTGVEHNNDPTYDHIAVEKAGDVVHGTTNDLFGPVQMDATLTNVKTGLWYDFQINYNPTTKLLTVYFNGSLRVSLVYDLQANIFTGSPWVYWGFTSATGGHNNIHQIYINKTITTHLLEDTTICSGSIPVTLDPLTNLRGTNVALNNPVNASSGTSNMTQAVDGNMGSRWESAWGIDPQWIYVDLQSPTDIDSVTLNWEGAYATAYQLQTSNDAATWTTVYSTTTNTGGKNKIVFSASNVRYVRMYGTARSLSAYGYSIWEFAVYGQPKYLWSPNDGTVSDIYGASVTLSPAATTTYSVLIPDPCVGFTSYNMTVTISCPAPVELINFTAKPKNEGTSLQWSTASEHNSHYFEILKSTDGINFNVLGYVYAGGNKSTLQNYSYEDNESFSGTVYYKLITVDLNGSKQESEIKSVSKASGKAFITRPVFEDETSLVIPAGSQLVEYIVLDMVGHELLKTTVQNPSTILIGQLLPPACYLVHVKTDSYQETIKISKIK